DCRAALLFCAVLAVAGSSSRAVTLGWDPTPGANGYKLYYGTSSSNYTSVVDAGASTTNRITGLQIGTKYYFAVSAYNDFGESDPSTEIAYTVTNAPPVISAPSALTANKETLQSISGVSISDDSSTGNYTLTLRANYGRVQIATSVSGGVAAGQVAGNNSTNVQVTAPLPAINATLSALNGVSYVGGLNFVGSDVLTLSIRDNGNAQTA